MSGNSGPRKLKEWQRRMARFDTSRRSVTRFCQDEGVSVPSFYHWRKKLQPPVPRSADVKGRAPSFTPVRLVASPSVTVRLSGGTQLEIPTVDPHVLQLTIQTVVRTDAERTTGGEAC